MIKLPIRIEIIQKYWFYPITIVVLNFLLFILFLYLLDFGWLTFILYLLVGSPLNIYWWYTTKLPKNKNSIGIILAIKSDSSVDREKFENDFLNILDEEINREYKWLNTKSYSLPKYYCDLVNTEKAEEYLAKTNCHMCVYGTIKIRNFSKERSYILNLNCMVVHSQTSNTNKNRFANELSELIPRNLALKVDDEIVSFLVISEWLKIYIFYNLIIACILSSDFKNAQKLLNRLKNYLKNTSQKHPAIETIKNRLNRRQLEIFDIEIKYQYQKWRNTKNENNFKRINELSSKALELRSSDARFLITLGISEIVLNQNLNKSLKIFLKIKKLSIVRLNIAFILCLKGKYDRSFTYYSETDFEEITVDQINQIEEFTVWYINEFNRDELYLVLLLINFFGKGDYQRSLEDYNLFFEFCRKNGVDSEDSFLSKLYNKIDHKIQL